MSKPALRDMLLYLISRSKRTILPPAAKAIQVSVSVKIMGSRAYTYLVGIGVTHSIAPPMHNYIAKSLGYDWEFRAQECPSVEHAINLFRQPTFAGGVVTMPYKRTIMEHLDGLDEYATKLAACNNVYRSSDGQLRGTNTDWRGIEGCLLSASTEGKGKPAVVIGAGGACRAAIFTLHERLGCSPIYIVNRDADETAALFKETKQNYEQSLQLVHVQSVEQVQGLAAAYYIVGTVPDAEPTAPEELQVHQVLNAFLEAAVEKGVLLDMCFKPRNTRILRAGKARGWKTVEGTEVIGHQIHEQYRLWCGEEQSKRIRTEEAWAVLRKAAEESPAINF
jgi:quinate dehydrogenase